MDEQWHRRHRSVRRVVSPGGTHENAPVPLMLGRLGQLDPDMEGRV
jgi:hypothetical protein